jgi:type II secretory pathway pseudopilin PulG
MCCLSPALDRAPASAFSRTELLVVLSTLVLLLLLLRPAAGHDADASEQLVCLNNMRQIMMATAMYAADHDDRLPHPSWGTVDGGNCGPDNWCYATRLATGQWIPSAVGKSGPDAHTNQLPWYRSGQLAPYLESQRMLICPTDWREAMSIATAAYRGRYVKLTSYVMNGAVGDYTGRRSPTIPGGSTHRRSAFLPNDILLFEQDASEGFYFNDAGNNPETVGEGLTQRHASANGEGQGVVGRAGGAAEFMKWSAFTNLAWGRNYPNDVLCGPRNQ